MNKLLLFSLISTILTGCFHKKSTFGESSGLENIEIPTSIEYYKNTDCHLSDTASFIISDKDELKNAIDEIKNADNPEPWKGCGGHLIRIHFPDSVVNIGTFNNRKIGFGSSGTFYDLEKQNFITRRIND
jgi:hypothetical protein